MTPLLPPFWVFGLALAVVAPYGVKLIERIMDDKRRKRTRDVMRHAGIEAAGEVRGVREVREARDEARRDDKRDGLDP